MHQGYRKDKQGGNSAKLNRKPLKPISDKRKKQQAAYRVLREDYLKRHKNCEICGTPNPSDIHHKGGRSEDKLNDFTNVMALCRPCHHKIHMVSPSWARENGYLE
jgi:5-methylcytosine-specific restriction endonuclease McrA